MTALAHPQCCLAACAACLAQDLRTVRQAERASVVALLTDAEQRYRRLGRPRTAGAIAALAVLVGEGAR
jgi:hypothetical protein